MTIRRQIRDTNWVRQSFLVSTDTQRKPDLEAIEIRNRTFTTARFKFVDTTPGGNICINPPPQFTRNADPKVNNIFTPRTQSGRTVQTTGSRGIGRYYSEAIDDNMRIISMRMGVPQFNSLTTFFTGFYNADAGSLARTGRTSSWIYTFFRAAAFVVPLLSLPILFITWAGNTWRYLTGNPSSKYYYLKPTMPLYWNAVNSIVNLIAVNKGIIPRFFDEDTRNKIGDNRFAFTNADLQRFSQLMPDIMRPDGGIDVYALSTRAQRIARRVFKQMEIVYNQLQTTNGGPDQLAEFLDRVDRLGMQISPDDRQRTFARYLSDWFSASRSQVKSPTSPPASGQIAAPDNGSSGVETLPTTQNDVDTWDKFLEAELDDGSSFISFRVDSDGPVSESFSNTVGESDIASKFNGMSGESRSTAFNFAGGNISGDTVLGGMIQSVLGVAADAVRGVRDGLQLSGLAALGGAAFVDIPQHWQSSVANLPSMSYSFTLSSPYGNKLSQLTNIYIPLAMILACALPLSTGRQSYSSPFLVELYDRGRAQTRLGIIDSLSISRGTSNLSFNNSGEPMAIDVSFTVKDLSTVMHMPIIQGFSLTTPTASVFDDDSTFSDYMGVLGSLTLQEQIYTGDKLRLAFTRLGAEFRSWKSTARWMQLVGDLPPARLASIFYTGIVNR